MQYYKLIQDNAILGVVTSNNFIAYSSAAQCFLQANEEIGEYIEYQGQLYRSTWMQPITRQKVHNIVTVLPIEESEYLIYKEAIEKNEEIIEYKVKEQEEIEEPVFINQDDLTSINFIRSSKLKEMSNICRKTIEQGFDMDIRGETKHFSLNTQDQLNLMSLGVMAQNQSMIPYHADREEVMFYAAEEIQDIIDSANAFKIYHTTYYNALKGYINSLETIEDIAAVTYGMEIPEEYQTNVLKALEA